MKIIFVGINAKYIHTNPAIRILNKITNSKYESSFVEFTIKDNIDHIVDYLKEYDSINFSCYIWNIKLILDIVKILKDKYPSKIIMAGGPEVSYDTAFYINYFDYIISGEGEEVILDYFDYINNNTDVLNEHIASKANPIVKYALVKDMNNVPSIIDCYNEDDIKNKIIYVETNRGCPFKCSYCLSSLETGVRFFSDEYVSNVLKFVKDNKFRCIKFLDRTFNVNPSRFIKICKYLEDSSNTYQFEVEPNLFNDEVVEYFINECKKDMFRLEIGIQSFNDKTINAIDRIQDGNKLYEIIDKINKAGRITIHIDLIAGLPYESLNEFKATFNKAFSLKCEELQLGFLKMLRGTKIRNNYKEFNYIFDENPPYEVKKNTFISEDEMNIIKDCENALEWMWNDQRCIHLIKHLNEDNTISSFFDFFVLVNKKIKNYSKIEDKYKQVINALNELEILTPNYIDDLKLDYLSKNLIKPIPFWIDSKINKKPFSYIELGLDKKYNNAFITDYYDSYIVISYYESKPKLEILQK